MDTLELSEVTRVSTRSGGSRSGRSNLPRVLILLGIFLILLYLYMNLMKPPAPENDGESAGIKSIFSIYGWDGNRLDSPDSVTMGPNGNIYVSDTGNHRIAVFNRNGKFQFAIGKKADKPEDQPKNGPLLFPLGLAVARNGDIYAASMERSLVLVFNSRGHFKRQISVDKPIDVAIRDDNLVVATAGSIEVYTLDGKKKSKWGSSGRRLGSFLYPNGLAYDQDGNLFVSDTQNSRIQILDPRGTVIGVAGKPPENLNDSKRMFGLNMGLALDEQQRVYVVDAFRHSIHIFDHDGNKLGEVGQQGELDGQFNYPSGIASLGGGLFAVADKWNDRVQVVRIDLPRGQTLKDRAQLIYPYLILVLLVVLLAYLSWRRRRLERSGRPGSGSATGTFG
jgi:DNA-binding beta-propeller fold protein YncE